MGQCNQLLLLVAVILTFWAVGSESFDMTKPREYKCVATTGDDFIKYLKAMDMPVKDGRWEIEGNLVQNITVWIGKNRRSHWQCTIHGDLLAEHFSITTFVIFKSETESTTTTMMDQRNSTQTLTVGKDSLTRKIKVHKGGLESTQTATFSENGERLTVTLKTKGVVATLDFKKEPKEITAKELDLGTDYDDDD